MVRLLIFIWYVIDVVGITDLEIRREEFAFWSDDQISNYVKHQLRLELEVKSLAKFARCVLNENVIAADDGSATSSSLFSSEGLSLNPEVHLCHQGHGSLSVVEEFEEVRSAQELIPLG